MNICPKKPSFSFFAKNNNSPNVVVTIPKEPTQLSSNTDFEIIRIKTSIEINETDYHILRRAVQDYKDSIPNDEFPVHYANIDSVINKLKDAKSRIIKNVITDNVE